MHTDIIQILRDKIIQNVPDEDAQMDMLEDLNTLLDEYNKLRYNSTRRIEVATAEVDDAQMTFDDILPYYDQAGSDEVGLFYE